MPVTGTPRVYDGCRLIAVIDGDTMDFDMNYGFLCHQTHRLRLAHINAPEHNTAAGDAATVFATSWLNDRANTVTVTTYKNLRTGELQDKWARYLAVITDTAGVSLNQTMLDTGHAVPY